MQNSFGAVYYNFPHAGVVQGFFDGHPFVSAAAAPVEAWEATAKETWSPRIRGTILGVPIIRIIVFGEVTYAFVVLCECRSMYMYIDLSNLSFPGQMCVH